MKRTTIFGLLLGLAVTLVIAGLDYVGADEPWERRSIDFRFAEAPRPPEPMSDEIVHVDIDDASIKYSDHDFPWPRWYWADALGELHRAGARTVALDLLFSTAADEPEDDDAFAGALKQLPCVLAVDVRSGSPYDDVWRESPDARAELTRVLDVLAGDINLDIDDVMTTAGVTGPRRDRVLSQPVQYREAAAWEALQRTGADYSTFEEFERAVTPRLSDVVNKYSERPILESAWRSHQAWRAAQKLMIPSETRGNFNDEAPIAKLLGNAAGVGFVSAHRKTGTDSVFREASVVLEATGGSAIQFAVAAAMTHRGVEVSEISVQGNRVVVGDTELPLRDGRMIVRWPTTTVAPPDRWRGLFAPVEGSTAMPGHLAIREVLELAEARRTTDKNRAELRAATRDILEVAEMSHLFPGEDVEELSEATLAAAADEVEFTLMDPEDPDAEESYRNHRENCTVWPSLRRAYVDGGQRIREVEQQLRERVEGKLVFVGWTATGSQADFFSTAVDPKTPGVVIHAAIANMVLTGRGVHVAPRGTSLVLILIIGAVCSLIAARLGALPSALLTGIVLGAFVVIGGWWFFVHRDMIVPLVAPFTAGASSWMACTALQAAISQAERNRVTRQFKARVSAQLVDHLTEHPDALTVTGEERELTVMFTDLAGFTAISESLGGSLTVSTLNRYMSALTEASIKEDAYINKFLGDGFMAFWSAFSNDPEQARKACRAAMECQRIVQELNQTPEMANVPDIGLRIGIATGSVIVGDCGAPPGLNDYTVIGDAVNLASRLESANKQFGTSVLINGRTHELANDTVTTRPIGQVVVVGQSAPSEVFEILPDDTPSEVIDVTRTAITAFQAGSFDEATKAFEALAKTSDHSQLAAVYTDALDRVSDEKFDGVLRLQIK